MSFPGRWLQIALWTVVVAVGIVVLINRDLYALGSVVALCGLVAILVLNLSGPARRGGKKEPEDIDKITPARRRELVRGTSLHLREMKYRYSIRPDPGTSGERQCFTTEVNTVRLGFIPVLITDNTNDRQGFGYVAFVYDGSRWRGPGLPCPGGQTDAVRHAGKCVSPLATDEETGF